MQMKLFETFRFPFFIIALFIIVATSNHGCKPDDNEDIDNGCDTCVMVYKPNIYIYPIEKTEMYITLNFPKGGKVVTSVPEYGSGWNITVDKSGLINDSFDYLFYESSQPDVWQLNEGWIVKRENLKAFFDENMTSYGFAENEIVDFTDYWIPRLKTGGSYAIYPQNQNLIESVIQLEISKKPDNLLRLFYVIRESGNNYGNILPEPKIDKTFKREGFFVTEWGVVLK
jgi:hypothetical protein